MPGNPRIPAKFLTGDRFDFCRAMLQGLNSSGVMNEVFATWLDILRQRPRKRTPPLQIQDHFAAQLHAIEQMQRFLGVFFEDLPKTQPKSAAEIAAAAALAVPPPAEDGELARIMEQLPGDLRNDPEFAREYLDFLRSHSERKQAPTPEP